MEAIEETRPKNSPVRLARDTAARVQLVKNRMGLRSADIVITRALDALEKQEGGNGNGRARG